MPIETATVRIVINGCLAQVYIGDQKVAGVRAYRLKHDEPGSVALLQLDLLALDCEIEGDAIVETTSIDAPVRSFASAKPRHA